MENLRQVLYNFHRCNNNSTQFNQEMEKPTNTTECQGELYLKTNLYIFLWDLYYLNSGTTLPSFFKYNNVMILLNISIIILMEA